MPDIGTTGLIIDILGDVSDDLRAGFVPSIVNNLKAPQLKAVATLFSLDWEQFAIYEPQDSELDMVTCLIREGRGLDVAPKEFARIKVGEFGVF